jgi:hypothetical protein
LRADKVLPGAYPTAAARRLAETRPKVKETASDLAPDR